MKMKLDQHRDLAPWPDSAWEALDIHLFIAANFTRYCADLFSKVGTTYLPSDAHASLLGLYCDVAHRPLQTLHRRHLDVRGDRRNQIMLGTLKKISLTRMVEALIEEFPAFAPLTPQQELDDSDEEAEDTWPDASPRNAQDLPWPAGPPPYDDSEALQQDAHLSRMLESVRFYLTPTQYRYLRLLICEGLEAEEIAERQGCGAAGVRNVLRKARRRLLSLAPDTRQDTLTPCLRRNRFDCTRYDDNDEKERPDARRALEQAADQLPILDCR